MTNQTFSQLGCAGIVAVVAFSIGGIGSLFVADSTLAERGLLASGVAAAAFVAAWLLAGDDHRRHVEAIRSVRKTLVDRQSLDDAEFTAQLLGDDKLGIHVRSAIAAYFQVLPEKILPTDELRRDYQYDVLGPSFERFIVAHVCTARRIDPEGFFVFRSAEVKDVADLCVETKRIIDGFAPT